MRHGKVNLIGIVVVLALIVGAVWCYAFVPYYWDKRKMDLAVESAALYWKDFGVDRAKRQLTEELHTRQLDDYLDSSDCKFTESAGKSRTISCSWTVEENWPFTSIKKVMHFTAERTVNPDGTID